MTQLKDVSHFAATKNCALLIETEEHSLQIRIDFPFFAQFEVREFISNSRELRTQALQDYLRNSGMELGHPVESFQVSQFRGDDNGEFWTITTQK